MKVAVATDTNSGMFEEEAKKMNIGMVRMPIVIDEEMLFEGVDIDEESFFEALYSGKDVTTSQPSPGSVMEVWDELLDQGYDEVVYIPMSSALSGSCETAIMLADDYEGKVQVVDCKRISVTQLDAVLTAVKLAEKGLSAKEIKDHLEETSSDSGIYVAVDTLEFLKKGGRITPAVYTIGTALNIKPILSLDGGKLDSFAIVISLKHAMPKMISAIKKDIETKFHDDWQHIKIYCAGAGLIKEEIAAYLHQINKAFSDQEVSYSSLPLSICTHVGKGAIGIGFTYQKDEALL